MTKLLIFTTGLLSFLHFIFPKAFVPSTKVGVVLGITSIEQTANIQTVKTALNIYCLNKQKLPERLNDLYGDELSKTPYLDLDSKYKFEKFENCEFSLSPK